MQKTLIEQVKDIATAAESFLGSLQEPSFEQVYNLAELRPYSALVDKLSEAFWVHQYTDLNHDVGAYYALMSYFDRSEEFYVHASFLGKFAMVLVGAEGGAVQLIDGPREGASTAERYLMSVMSQEGFTLISKEVALSPLYVARADWGASPGDMKVHHVLFSFDENWNLF
jgi:hypothetical protein